MSNSIINQSLRKLIIFGVGERTSLYTNLSKLFYLKSLEGLNDLLFELLNDEEIVRIYRTFGSKLAVLDSDKPIQLELKSYLNTHNDNFNKTLREIKFNYEDLNEIKGLLIHFINRCNSKSEFLKDYLNVFFDFIRSKSISIREKALLFTEKNVWITDEIDKLNINTLDLLTKYFNNFRYKLKTSESSSLIFTAELTEQIPSTNSVKKRQFMKPGSMFFFKVYPIDNKFTTLGLQAETRIYDELYKLVKYNVTPNILCKTITTKMKNFSKFYDLIKKSPKMTAELNEALIQDIRVINLDSHIDSVMWKKITHKSYMWNEYELLMTHPGGDGTSFDDCFYDLTPLELKHVMFQIIYTLYVFDCIEMSHGDLHCGNIFVITLDKPREFCYKVGDKFFQFTTNKLVKIYDFDNSTLCKTSQMNLGLFGNSSINQVLNKDRDLGKRSNKIFAQTNIYNKNLDFIIMVAWGLFIIAELNQRDPYTFDLADQNFNEFIRDSLRGFSGRSEYSKKTIRDTLQELADITYPFGPSKDKEANLRELNRIMGKSTTRVFNRMNFYDISSEILNMTWEEYYKNGIQAGKIVKSLNRDGVDNNHMWIPDEIVMDKVEMLNHPYFKEMLITDLSQINTKRTPIYSIEAFYDFFTIKIARV
jgi:hypothetical protein